MARYKYDPHPATLKGCYRQLLQRFQRPGESLADVTRRLILTGATAVPSSPRGMRWTGFVAVMDLDEDGQEITFVASDKHKWTVPFLGDCS